jgi:antitoxin component of RelBE/YafQ-DinJ toxin-antitoxin module
MDTTMTIKIDKRLKAKAQETAKRIGIPLSTLIHAYLKEFSATGHIEFTATEEMTPQMERIIAEAEAEIARGEVSPAFDSSDFENMRRWLESDED